MLKMLLADPPVPTITIFFNVDASILLKVSFICFWDAARYSNDEKIKIYNALIWESQDLSFHPRRCKNLRLRLRRVEKWSIFCTARRKRLNFFKCRWFCPPLEKFLRAPMGPALKALHVHTVDAQAGSRLVTRYIVGEVVALTSRQCRLVAVTTDSIQNHV